MIFVLTAFVLSLVSMIVPSSFDLTEAPNSEREPPDGDKHHDDNKSCFVDIKCECVIPESTCEVELLCDDLSDF